MENIFAQLKINVIMPMLGKGTRMNGIQNGTLKPLLKFKDGTPFFIRSLKSLDSYNIKKLFLIIPIEYEDLFHECIKTYKPLFKNIEQFVPVTADYTSSPVETLKIAIELVEEKIPLISLDCDIYAKLPYYSFKDDSAHLFLFETNEKNKSFVKTKGNNITEIKEKVPISNLAVFGAYMFKEKRYIEDNLENSKFLSDIVKKNIENNLVTYDKLDSVENFGTEEEYNSLLTN